MSTANTITDKDIDLVGKTISKAAESGPTADFMKKAKELAEEAGKLSNEEVKVKNYINPITGKPLIVDDTEDDLKYCPSFEELIADDSIKTMDIDPSTLQISDKNMSTILEVTLGDLSKDLTPEDLDQLLNCLNRHKRGEKFQYYMEAPECIKKKLDESVGTMSTPEMRSIKNNIIKELYDGIVNDAIIDNMTVSINDSIEADIKKMNEDIAGDKYWGSVRQYFLEGCIEKADKLDAEGKHDIAERFRVARESYIQSYTYERMLEEYKKGKLKVKKIKIDKFKKTCEEFNLKYVKSKNEINDIKLLLPALDKKADPAFDLDVIQEFICVFIEYTNKFKFDPNDYASHIFMYYFIHNILTLDMYDASDEKDKEFHNQLRANINNFLLAIVDRRNSKKEV